MGSAAIRRYARTTPAEARSRSARASRSLLVAAFAAVYLIWGSTYLAIKYAIETLPPFLMAGARFLVAGSVLWAWARARGETGGARPNWAEWRTAVVAGALLMLAGNGGVTWAEGRVASGLAALLVATEPFWMVVLNWRAAGGRRPRAGVWAGLVLGLCGVWLVVSDGTQAGRADPLGCAVVLGAAVAWAAGSIYSTRARQPTSPMLASGMQMVVGGALLAVAGLALGEWSHVAASRLSARSLLAFAYLVVFGSIVAFTAYTWLLRAASPARTATYAYVNPVVAVLLGWLIGGEALSATMIVGSVLIVSSVALVASGGEHAVAAPSRRGASVEETS